MYYKIYDFYQFFLVFCSANSSITFSKLMFVVTSFSMNKISNASNFCWFRDDL